MENNGNLWTVKELAMFLNIPDSSVYQLIFHSKRNGFPYLKIGQRCRFRRSEIEAWLERLAVNAMECAE